MTINLNHRIERMKSAILDRSFRVSIIGLGYVGLPLIYAFWQAGFNVLGIDVDKAKIAALRSGRSYMKHFTDTIVSNLAASDRFDVTDDFSRVSEADAVLICVPTPLTKYREPDLSFVVKTTECLAPHLRGDQIIVLESTTYPGTTREVMVSIIEQHGRRVGVDVLLAYSPEREDPGNLDFETRTIPKVIGADDDDSRDVAGALYGALIDRVVTVSSTATAEAVKLTENIFRSVNIALVNELKIIFERMQIDIWEVIEAAKTKPFGFMAFYPGPGLGGHCIPIDPFYLTWKAREYRAPTRFIELAGEIDQPPPSGPV